MVYNADFFMFYMLIFLAAWGVLFVVDVALIVFRSMAHK